MHRDHVLLATLVLLAIVLIAYCGCRHGWGRGRFAAGGRGRCPCGCPAECRCSPSCRCRRSGACPP